MAREDGDVVIVGAGPAGMMLAYQLASNGVKVRVLERGELMQRSVVEQLEKAGIFKILLERGLALPQVKRQMYVGLRRKVTVPGPVEAGAVVNQPGFLSLLHELCGKYPNYRLDFSSTALETIQTGGRVVGLKTRQGGTEGQVDGKLRERPCLRRQPQAGRGRAPLRAGQGGPESAAGLTRTISATPSAAVGRAIGRDSSGGSSTAEARYRAP